MQQVASTPDLATAARRYSSLGIPVFPCVPGGKQPLTSNGFHDASAAPDVVGNWWWRYPDANIGLPTGQVSGVVVVDIDIRGADSGYPGFERAQQAGYGDGWGWLVRTPSGGMHAYYLPSAAEQRSWSLPRAHVDFRGDGGYVVVPPSRIDGAAYEVIAIAQDQPGPVDARGLRQFLDPPRAAPRVGGPPAWDARPDRLAAWVASQPEGGRNQGLFWAASRMVENGHRFDTALDVLGDAARRTGLPDREVETTIRSAFRTASRASAGSRPGPTREAVSM